MPSHMHAMPHAKRHACIMHAKQHACICMPSLMQSTVWHEQHCQPVKCSACCLCSKSSSQLQLSAAAGEGLWTDAEPAWGMPCWCSPAGGPCICCCCSCCCQFRELACGCGGLTKPCPALSKARIVGDSGKGLRFTGMRCAEGPGNDNDPGLGVEKVDTS